MTFAAYMALMTPFVQTRLVDYFTRILEERTGTTISIGRVEFRPIESLILNDVFVRDCRQDTLVFCERLMMKVDSVSFVKRRFTITEAAFEKAKFNVWIERRKDGGESLTNVERLINSFSFSKADSVPQTSSEWNVNLAQVILKECPFPALSRNMPASAGTVPSRWTRICPTRPPVCLTRWGPAYTVWKPPR